MDMAVMVMKNLNSNVFIHTLKSNVHNIQKSNDIINTQNPK